MEDMLPYLDRDFPAPSDGKLQIIAVRHEDGSWGQSSYVYHEQRKKLFHELADVSDGHVDDDADAGDPRETGNIYIDVANLVASIEAGADSDPAGEP